MPPVIRKLLVASSKSDPMIALTPEGGRSGLNALPRKQAGAMFLRPFHPWDCNQMANMETAQPPPSRLEHMGNPGIHSRK
jgi:hypothetical protein